MVPDRFERMSSRDKPVSRAQGVDILGQQRRPPVDKVHRKKECSAGNEQASIIRQEDMTGGAIPCR